MISRLHHQIFLIIKSRQSFLPGMCGAFRDSCKQSPAIAVPLLLFPILLARLIFSESLYSVNNDPGDGFCDLFFFNLIINVYFEKIYISKYLYKRSVNPISGLVAKIPIKFWLWSHPVPITGKNLGKCFFSITL